MVFIRLGLINIRRQISRSVLVWVSVVLAAMSLTQALSFRDGEMKGSYQFYRDLLGGEILVSPVSWGQPSSDGTAGGRVAYNQLDRSGLSWLEVFYPELYSEGYLAPVDAPARQAFTPQELTCLAGHAGVSGVTIRPQLPAEMTSLDLLEARYSPFTVMPLPPEQMLKSMVPDEGLKPFSPPATTNSDVPLVWINQFCDVPEPLMNAALASITDQDLTGGLMDVVPTEEQLSKMRWAQARARATAEMKLPRVGDRAQLLLPRMRLGQDGDYVPDYGAETSVEVQIAGYVAIYTRSISWAHALQIVATEDAYLHASNLYVTKEAWQQIWRQVSDGAEVPLYNVSLQVADMSQIRPLLATLRAEFPQFTFVAVEQFAERMERMSRLDHFYRAPNYVYSPATEASLAMPAELGPITGLLLLSIAGMLTMSRVLTGAAARRAEIGVLKVLGARRKDIAVMVMSETALTAASGALVGFLLVRLGGLAIELSNGVPWSEIISGTAKEGLLVVSLATAVTLLSAALPAERLARLTVMGVLRGE